MSLHPHSHLPGDSIDPGCPWCLGRVSLVNDSIIQKNGRTFHARCHDLYDAQQRIARGKTMPNPSTASDPVNHPKHYTAHPSGIECIQITEHMGFCLGNAVKYIWRADLKNGTEDLRKAVWYLEREIAKREGKP